MKEFLKWLGVNEKVAKVVVWMLIIMIFLIVINTMLESIGLPYYKITVEHLKNINTNKLIEFVMASIVTLLGFYSIVFLVFRIKDFKKIFKYSLLYLILNIIINATFDYGISQIFIFTYMLIFFYLFSHKNWRYIIYGLLSIALNSIIQYICYLYKIRYIEFDNINQTNRLFLSLDFFIIMGIIILVKEIILNKKEEKICHQVGYGSGNLEKKTNLPKK